MIEAKITTSTIALTPTDLDPEVLQAALAELAKRMAEMHERIWVLSLVSIPRPPRPELKVTFERPAFRPEYFRWRYGLLDDDMPGVYPPLICP